MKVRFNIHLMAKIIRYTKDKIRKDLLEKHVKGVKVKINATGTNGIFVGSYGYPEVLAGPTALFNPDVFLWT